jgi:hypothetical protein
MMAGVATRVACLRVVRTIRSGRPFIDHPRELMTAGTDLIGVAELFRLFAATPWR